MKALISPEEIVTLSYVSSWKEIDGVLQPELLSVYDVVRVVEVQSDENVFEVASPMFWVDCPENCVAHEAYFEDGKIVQLPENTPKPE